MDRTERFYRIEALLRAQRIASLRDLIRHLEVSRATVIRDIEYLRDRFNWNIVWDATLRGYRFEGTETLPTVHFTAPEIQSLLTLEHLLSGIQPDLLGHHLPPMRQRLEFLLRHTRSLNNEEVDRRIRIVQPASRATVPAHFQVVSGATIGRQRLQLLHVNRATAERKHRLVSPQRLTLYRGTWYLDAWCHTSDRARRFALDALLEAALAEGPCQELSQESMHESLGEGYGIFAGPAARVALLRFSKRIDPWVQRESWHPHQEQSRDSDGRLLVQFPYSEDTELIMDIMRVGPDVEVLQPPDLRRHVAERLHRAAEQYVDR